MNAKVSNEELLGIVATFAGMVNKDIERAGKLDQQARQSLEAMARGHGAIQQQLAGVVEELRVKYAPAVVEATAKAGIDAIGYLNEAAQRAVESVRQAEDAALQGIEVARSEWKARMMVGAACLLVGVVLSPFLARPLSPAWRSQVAAIAMDTDRWSAGHEMLMLADPESWALEDDAVRLENANHPALEKCREAAKQGGKQVSCAVLVEPRR